MKKEIQKVLLIEDNSMDYELIQAVLHTYGKFRFELHRESSLEAGLKFLEHNESDCLLLDLSLPDSDGLDTFKSVKSFYSDLPIVILTALDEEKMAIESLELGAQDYLFKKDIEPHILSRAIRYAIERNFLQIDLKNYIRMLEYSEKCFRTILESTSDSFIVLDSEKIVRYVNPACLILFMKGVDDLMNKSLPYMIEVGEKSLIYFNQGTPDEITAEMHVDSVLWEGEKAYLATIRKYD